MSGTGIGVWLRMKIEWTPNPLTTRIHLDKNEVDRLRDKIIIEELEDIAFNAHYELTYNQDTEAAIKASDPEYYMGEDSPTGMEKRVDELLGWYLKELGQSHSGDCICLPCSCVKCRAEGLLGIDTIAGLGNKEGYYIHQAFHESDDIDGALEYLKNYNPEPTENWMVDWISKWINNARGAHDWLKNYKKEHGF